MHRSFNSININYLYKIITLQMNIESRVPTTYHSQYHSIIKITQHKKKNITHCRKKDIIKMIQSLYSVDKNTKIVRKQIILLNKYMGNLCKTLQL